jgi:hypothetical protein
MCVFQTLNIVTKLNGGDKYKDELRGRVQNSGKLYHFIS